MKGFILAVQFLTIIPLFNKSFNTVTERDVAHSCIYFPVVGFLQGLALYSLYYVLKTVFPLDITALILLLTGVLLNGGFHIDGLADTFDALAAKKEKEGKLAVMKDGTVGPIGVISIIMILLLKYVALKHIILNVTPVGLILFTALGKWSLIPAMVHGKNAREDGLGALFINHVGRFELFLSTLSTVLILCTLSFLFSESSGIVEIITISLLVTAAFYSFILFLTVLFQRQFGGITGDNLGAICEITETLFLITCTLLLW